MHNKSKLTYFKTSLEVS